MTVRITKPEINVREKLAELDKPSGIAGEAMLRAKTPQEQFNLIGAGRRNIIINGAMQVSQRGDYTTATTVADGYFLDRWRCDRNGTATIQHTSGHDIPGTPAICKAVKLVQTVTGNNYLGIRQKIENPSLYTGRTFTYSAWIRSNTPDARIECYIPGTSPNLYVGPSHSGNGQWEYLSFTFTLNTGTPTAFHADVFIDNGAYSNTTITAGEFIEVTMAQLELGTAATPFEHRSYGEELALCQRYFEVLHEPKFRGVTASGLAGQRMGVDFKTTKRVTPSVSLLGTMNLFNGISTTTMTSASLGSQWATVDNFEFDANVSIANQVSGQPCVAYTATTGTIYNSLHVDAEL